MIYRVSAFARRFRDDTRGSFAIMMGFLFPVALVGVGGAIDYTRSVTNTHTAQQALDSVVLALTRHEPGTVNLQQEGRRLLRQSHIHNGLGRVLSDIRFRMNGDSIEGSAIVSHDTTILNIIGIQMVDTLIKASATPPQNTRIEIALVLDVSNSMRASLNGASRLQQMKVAVNGMFDTLEDSVGSRNEILVSVVPYSSSVNLSNYRGALENRSLGDVLRPASGPVWAAERLISSIGTDYNISDTSPLVRPVPFVAADDMVDPFPLIPMEGLSPDIGNARQLVNSLQADGFTGAQLGMIWGVYALSPEWSNFWTEPPAPRGEADKIIVLLTDGEFNTTFNIGRSGRHFEAGKSAAELKPGVVTADGMPGIQRRNFDESNSYFREACELANDNGYIVYTVALNLDPQFQPILQDCVGSSGTFYSADSASDLRSAFENIANRLSQRRLDG